MAKKQPKKPAKKAAKKSTPKKQYKYKGKVISEEFAEILENLVQNSGKSIQSILNDKKLEPYIENLIKQFSITWFRKLGYISTTAKKYKKNELYLGSGNTGSELPVKTPEAMSMIATFESRIYESRDIIWIKYKTINTLDGKMVVRVPGNDDIDDDEIESYLESDDVMYMEYVEDEGAKIVRFHNPYQ